MVAVIKNGVIDGPIPGQSLTNEPGKHPWERPPQITDVDDALDYLFKIMMDEDKLISLADLIMDKIPVVDIASVLSTACVMEGVFSYDVKVLVAKPLAVIIYKLGEAMGLDPVIQTPGPPDGTVKAARRQIDKLMQQRQQATLKGAPTQQQLDNGLDFLQDEAQGSSPSQPQKTDGLLGMDLGGK